ncbi:MAG: response regulator [Archangium sp.]|nr:response regulator [Archangium sp.]
MTPNHARLLVADDSRMLRQVIRELLQDLGFVTIDEAPDGAAALSLFLEKPYDLVLTDWNMPSLSGIELLRAIRSGDVRNQTAVVLFTGDMSARRMVEALESGANGFVAKPFAVPALCDKILRIIASVPPKSEFVPTRIPSSLRARL